MITTLDGLKIETGISDDNDLLVLVRLTDVEDDTHVEEFSLTQLQVLALIKALTSNLVDYYQEEEKFHVDA